MTSVNLVGYIGFVYSLLFFFSVGIVLYYAEPDFPWHTYVTLTMGYYCSFGILLLVPIDIASCVVDRRAQTQVAYIEYQDNINILSQAYNVFFTMILILGTFILVYQEYYNTDGYFTFMGKLINSFIRMMIDITAMLVMGLIVLGILIGQKVVEGPSAILLAAVIVTNGVYEFFLMFFLSYGIIEFPRSLWNRSDLEFSLLQSQMKATQDYQNISDTRIDIQEEISKVKYFKDQINRSSTSDELKHAIKVLEEDCPSDFKSERKAKMDDMKQYLNRGGQCHLAGLAKLRSHLNLNKDKYKMAQAKILMTEKSAYFLEDLVNAVKARNGVIFWSLRNEESTRWVYLWYCVYQPIMYKVAAVICALLSFFSFLGVVCSMSGVPNSTSVYFLATHSHLASAPGIAVFILFTLGYTTYVTLWALFQIRVPGFVELVPFRTSPEYLSFNTRMCLRFAAPLAFFYLGWIAENGIKSGDWTKFISTNTTYINETVRNTTNITAYNDTYVTELVAVTETTTYSMLSAFSRFYNLQAVQAVSTSYGTGFPVILFIVIPLFVFNLFNRFFIFMKIPNFQFGTPIPTDEQLREGKRQLAKYKKIAKRAEERNVLRGYLASFIKPKTSTGDGDGSGGTSSSLFASFFRTSAGDRSQPTEPPKIEIKVPEVLSGDLEKKGAAGRLGGSVWKPIYGEVVKPGILYFFKDKKAAQSAFILVRSSDNAASSESTLENAALQKIDLKTIINFTIPDKKDSSQQLDLEMADDVIKLRFTTPEEAQHWKVLLQEWKDYAIDIEEQDSLNTDIEIGTIPGTTVINPLSEKKTDENVKRSQFDQNLYDLENIVVEDDPELVQKKDKGFMSKMFSFGVKSEDTKQDVGTSSAKDLVIDKPAKLEGFLEKKGKGKLNSEWQKRYCCVNEETSSLDYYKKKGDESIAGSIDLREAVKISMNTKSGKDDFGRFDIDTEDRVYKFKAKTRAEAERWVSQLSEWKDYFLLGLR